MRSPRGLSKMRRARTGPWRPAAVPQQETEDEQMWVRSYPDDAFAASVLINPVEKGWDWRVYREPGGLEFGCEGSREMAMVRADEVLARHHMVFDGRHPGNGHTSIFVEAHRRRLRQNLFQYAIGCMMVVLFVACVCMLVVSVYSKAR